MQVKYILISFLKAFAITMVTLAAIFIMAKLLPPPKGTAFDGLEYVLKPIYMSLTSGLIYLILALTKTKLERKVFLLALLINVVYVALLFSKIL